MIQKKRKKSLTQLLKRSALIVFLASLFTVLLVPQLRQKISDYSNEGLTQVATTFENFVSKLNFTLQRLRIEGLDYISQSTLLEQLELKTGTNLVNLDVQELAKRLQNIGWIQSVSIYKRLPNTLEIQITEYKPYALWQNQGKVSVITENGTIIPSAHAKNFGALPLVVGKGANIHCKHILNIFADYPSLKDKLSAIQYMHERRWRLHLTSEIMVDLPEDDVGDTLHKLHTLHHQQKILDRDVKIIDMRIRDRLIIKGSSVVGQQKS